MKNNFYRRARLSICAVLLTSVVPCVFGGPVTLTVDSTQTLITVSGAIAGSPLSEQGPGSLTAHFSGAVNAVLDNDANPTTLSITSCTLTATVNGTWSPLPGGAVGKASANIAATSTGFPSGDVAVRSLVVNAVMASTVPLVNHQFVSTGVQVTVLSGNMDYLIMGGILKGTSSLAGVQTNNLGQSGSVTVANNTTSLNIPINLNFIFGNPGSQVTMNWVGALVASATSTNAPPDTTAPTLVVSSPTELQSFGAAAINVNGTATDASGIQSVTVNGAAATLNGSNWSTPLTLSTGTNTITVIATDSSANHNAATQTVHAVFATVPPVAGFTGLPTGGAAPLTVVFTDSSTGAITTRTWDFGDGGNSTATSPSHVFNSAGVFSVSLTVLGPNGQNVLTRNNYITVTNTNTTPDTVQPSLTVSSPTDFQTFTSAGISVSGVASDLSGIASVTVNGTAATLNGGNWSSPVTLAPGTNTLTVVATDASTNHNTTTQTVHAILQVGGNHAPLITVAPAVTNAMLKVNNQSVVVAGETNVFSVAATDADGNALTYQWAFGDGTTSASSPLATASHVYAANCGPLAASVTVSDGQTTTTSNLTVAVACAFNSSKASTMKVGVNFDPKKTNADSASVTGLIDLPGTFNPLGQVVTVSLGDAQFTVTLDSKGRGVAVVAPAGAASCRMTKPSKTTAGAWTLTASLSKGNWGNLWTPRGFANMTIPTPGITLTLPAVVIINGEAFATDPLLHYTATLNKSGKAK